MSSISSSHYPLGADVQMTSWSCIEQLVLLGRLLAITQAHDKEGRHGAYLRSRCAVREWIEQSMALLSPGIDSPGASELRRSGTWESTFGRVQNREDALLRLAFQDGGAKLLRFYTEWAEQIISAGADPVAEEQSKGLHALRLISLIACVSRNGSLVNDEDRKVLRSEASKGHSERFATWARATLVRAGEPIDKKDWGSDWLGEVSYSEACARAIEERFDSALASLETMVRGNPVRGSEDVDWILRDPDLEGLRKSSAHARRFEELIRRGLVRPYTAAATEPSFGFDGIFLVMDTEHRGVGYASERAARLGRILQRELRRFPDLAVESQSEGAGDQSSSTRAFRLTTLLVSGADEAPRPEVDADIYEQLRPAMDLVVVHMRGSAFSEVVPRAVQIFLQQREDEGTAWLRKVVLLTEIPTGSPKWADETLRFKPGELSGVLDWDFRTSLGSQDGEGDRSGSEALAKEFEALAKDVHEFEVAPLSEDCSRVCVHVDPELRGNLHSRLDALDGMILKERLPQLAFLRSEGFREVLRRPRQPPRSFLIQLYGQDFVDKYLIQADA